MYQYEVLMAKQERRAPLPRIVDFEADAFDMATNDCASRTWTPFLIYLYEFESVDNATLTGVGTGRVIHMGKAKYVFLDLARTSLSTTTKCLFAPTCRLESFLFRTGPINWRLVTENKTRRISNPPADSVG